MPRLAPPVANTVRLSKAAMHIGLPPSVLEHQHPRPPTLQAPPPPLTPGAPRQISSATTAVSRPSHRQPPPQLAVDLVSIAAADAERGAGSCQSPPPRRGHRTASVLSSHPPHRESPEKTRDPSNLGRSAAYSPAHFPILLIRLPGRPPWTCRAPPAEAAAGPVGLLIARQPAMRAADAVVVTRLPQDLPLSVVTGGLRSSSSRGRRRCARRIHGGCGRRGVVANE